MARTIQQIQNSIIQQVQANPTLVALNSVSQTAIWQLVTYVIAVCQWTLETLFDQHKAEVTGIIDNLKPHSLKWYANMAKAFEYGYNLVADADYYDNTALTADQVTASLIVAYSAVVEQTTLLRVKVATLSGGDLAPLTAVQLAAFTQYMNMIKDAGVKLQVDSLPPDGLRLQMRIFYNPLVLDGTGARLDGTAPTPISDAINAYLKALPFNGYLVLAYLLEAIQAVDGVVIPKIDGAQAQYGLIPYLPIDVQYNPDAGYLRLLNPGDLTLTFIPQTPLQ